MIARKLNEQIVKILEKYHLFNVGDRVEVPVEDNRTGTIINQVAEDIYEVELDEWDGLASSIKRYHEDDLQFFEDEPSVDEPIWFDDYYYGDRS